jgi:hypothetical protein
MKTEAGIWKVKTTHQYSLLKINSHPFFLDGIEALAERDFYNIKPLEPGASTGAWPRVALAGLVGEHGRWRRCLPPWWVSRGGAGPSRSAGGGRAGSVGAEVGGLTGHGKNDPSMGWGQSDSALQEGHGSRRRWCRCRGGWGKKRPTCE